jgi:hypothetical protein
MLEMEELVRRCLGLLSVGMLGATRTGVGGVGVMVIVAVAEVGSGGEEVAA